jgi:hypothetical protein
MSGKEHVFVVTSFHEEIFGKSVTFQMGLNANAIIQADPLMMIFILQEGCMKTIFV